MADIWKQPLDDDVDDDGCLKLSSMINAYSGWEYVNVIWILNLL